MIARFPKISVIGPFTSDVTEGKISRFIADNGLTPEFVSINMAKDKDGKETPVNIVIKVKEIATTAIVPAQSAFAIPENTKDYLVMDAAFLHFMYTDETPAAQ